MTISETTAQLGRGGRLVIPARIRRLLRLKEGDEVRMVVSDGELRIVTFQAGIRRAQQMLAPHMPKDRSLADELVAERRLEALRE